MRKNSLTEGPVLGVLLRFAVPIFFTLLLQALYGGVDLMVVGQFAETADVSGVSVGSLIIQTMTGVVTALAVGIAIRVGQFVGAKDPEQAGRAIGGGIFVFSILAAVLTAALVGGGGVLAHLVHAPEEAFSQTTAYIRICGAGTVFIVAYNVMGSVFRGIGDSKTPLAAVCIACVCNILGDLILVAGFHMGAAGAALATVAAQAVSVLVSIAVLTKRKNLPFQFSRSWIRFDRIIVGAELKLGVPVALQDLLTSLSFVIIQTIVNDFGLVASAGVGVAEKVCIFIMLVPSACSQSMSSFVAQNLGAGHPDRAKKGLVRGILVSLAAGIVMGYVSFFHGDLLAAIFAKNDVEVITAAQSYLRVYGIECLLVPFLFCMLGFFNGYGKTLFVMIQGLIGAFCVRVPVVYAFSRMEGATLFHIGLSIPIASTVQIVLCLLFYFYLEWRSRQKGEQTETV